MRRRQKNEKIQAYRCKTKPLSGHRYVDIAPQARKILRTIQKRTKRRAYIRSAYFHKDKIFFDFFWQHMQQKLPSDQARRLKYLPCALELLRNTRNDPITFMDPAHPSNFLHRFLGETREHEQFWVLVKEDRRSNRKQLLSVFPYK